MQFHAFAESYLVPAQLAFAMLGMGATLAVRDFASVVRDPRGLALGLILQLVFVPLLAVGWVEAFDLGKGWAVGLFLVAVVPGGAFSNLLTFIGRGNVPLSISVTVASTAGCIATVPLLLGILAQTYLPADFVFPTDRVVVEIFAYLLIPLAIGMVVFRIYGERAEPISRWSIRLSILLIVVITISALGSGRISVPEYGWRPPLIIFAFGVTLGVVVPLVCRVFRRYDDDATALGIEVTVRNIGVALLLVHFFFPGDEANGQVLYTCLFYAGSSLWFAVPMLASHRYGRGVLWFLPNRTRPEPLCSQASTPSVAHESPRKTM